MRGGGLEVLGLDADLVVGVRLQPRQAVPAIKLKGKEAVQKQGSTEVTTRSDWYGILTCTRRA